jgi:hypothetical protein
MPAGIARSVYRATVLSINEVQEDGLPPKWWLDLGSGMQPAQKTCTSENCSGHIQQHMYMPPTMQTTQ